MALHRFMGCLGQLCFKLWGLGGSFSCTSHPSAGTIAPPGVCSSHRNGRDMREQVETQEDMKVLA